MNVLISERKRPRLRWLYYAAGLIWPTILVLAFVAILVSGIVSAVSR